MRLGEKMVIEDFVRINESQNGIAELGMPLCETKGDRQKLLFTFQSVNRTVWQCLRENIEVVQKEDILNVFFW